MTDCNDLMPAKEKLEWVTPKILRMGGARDTEGNKGAQFSKEGTGSTPINPVKYDPS
jgi:hypothetical protein